MSEEIEKLWERHNVLSETVGKLETAKELHSQRLGQHDSYFTELVDKLDKIHDDFQQRAGADKAKKYDVWLAFSLIALLFTAINLYMGMQ